MANIFIPLGDPPPRGRLANFRRHPFGHDRYIRFVNELGQSAAEFDAAGYPTLAAAAVAARHTIQDLWTATQNVEKAEEREIEEAGAAKANAMTPTPAIRSREKPEVGQRRWKGHEGADLTKLLNACGLTNEEAGRFIGVKVNIIDYFAALMPGDQDGVPENVLRPFRRLDQAIDAAAEQTLAWIRLAYGMSILTEIEVGLATTDDEARSLGLPCVGAHRALLSRVIVRGTMRGYRVRIVPRRKTLPSLTKLPGHNL